MDRMKSPRIFLLLFTLASLAEAARLKDIARIRGAKENQLVGYSLVVGLAGTGDRSGDFTETSLNMALKGLGVDVRQQKLITKNTAAVLVTATIPPFQKLGSKIDVIVSSIGSAVSLEGGNLLMTPLKGPDGKIYAIAQGRIALTRLQERTATAFQGMLTSPIPDGAIIEREVPFDLSELTEIKYHLNNADFTTSARVAHKINEELSGKFAEANDASTISITLPYLSQESLVELIAKVENLEIDPDHVAKVVVNRKTGSVVLGEYVKLYPISLAHNNLKIQIREDVREPMSQPLVPPAGDGMAPASPKTPRTLKFSNQATSIADIVTSLNEVGANPEDIVFLLQSLKSSGALLAELEIKG